MAAHPHSTAEYAAASGSETYSGFESESLGGSFDSSPDQESTDPALSVDDGRASRPEEKQAVGVQNTGILLDLQDDGACLRGVEISISDPEKRQGSNAVNMRELFTVYLVEARFVDGDREPTSVWRRYSEFEVLRNYLLVTHPYVVIPPLPEKRAEFVWHKLSADNMDPDFVERRRVGLETFLLRVIEHLQLSRDPIVSSFLSQENGWKETVNNTEFQAKADSLLKSLSATFRVKNPDKRFVELKCYCDELHTIISQLLKVQMRVADRLYGIYKIHANYGRVFSEWSAIEKDMGDGLQSAGHHMDVYAVSIDDMLEEEEHYADHLKEFLYYTESLRSVCSKHELLQYELEQLQYALLAKKQQREELSTGMVRMFSLKGVTSKLFGQETAEQRQSKLQLVDKQIAEDERCVSAKQQENRDFVEKAWQDVERFQRQKYKDLKETIRSYATMQMNMCKKGIAVWTNAKECFNKI